MSMNRAEIAIVVGGLAEAVGGFVQKVRQTAQGRLYLDVRVPGRSFRVFLCVESGRTRICLGDEREEGPRTPLAFQGLLRSRLTGAQLKSIAQPAGDRCVHMVFDARGATLALVAELTGRHGNLLLVSGDGTVLGCAVQGGTERRGLRPGARYEPPPVPMTLASAAETAAPRFPPGLSLEELSRQVEEAYRQREREENAAREKASRMAPLKARLKKSERALLAARNDLARTEKADDVKRTADLLKANMRLVHPGDRELSVTDYREDGIFQVVVKLDPSLPPQEQVEAGYRKYRHLLSGREKAGQRVAMLSAEVESLRKCLDALERGDGTGAEVPAAATAGALPPAARQSSRKLPKGKSPPFREYVSLAGQRIWVGRNAALNDALTFKCARGNDVWFHARGVPGSHVVVPLDRGEAMAEATRLDALTLARHFSNFRDDAGEVSWTLVKYVRRQKDGAPGAVVYSQERTVLVRPDVARLARLTSASSVQG